MLSDPIHRGILTFFNPESIIKYGIPGVMRTCFIMTGYFLKGEGVTDNILCQWKSLSTFQQFSPSPSCPTHNTLQDISELSFVLFQ